MIFMCFLANVINFVDRANLAIAAPSIRAELGLDAVGMGLVLSAFFWTYAFLQLPAGWFIDKVGVRVSLALAVGWWSAFTIATGAARGLAQLVGVRLMLGGCSLSLMRACRLPARMCGPWWAKWRRHRLTWHRSAAFRTLRGISPAFSSPRLPASCWRSQKARS
jgi:MFS family permease